MERYEISDEVWEAIALSLPGKPGDPGRHAKDNRLFINAIVWVARTGAQWRALPAVFGEWNSVFQRFNRWSKKGVWERVLQSHKLPDLEVLLLDSTSIRAHQHAAGAAGKKTTKRSAARGAATPRKSILPAMAKGGR
jgi:putative transposase